MAGPVLSMMSVFLLSLAFAAVRGAKVPCELGVFATPHPSFVDFFPSSSTRSGQDLWITSFQAFGDGHIGYVPNVGSYSPGNISQISPTAIAPDFTWPNSISIAPANYVAGADPLLVVPDGFLVPGHNNGNIFLVSRPTDSQAVKVSVTAPKNGYFYHHAEWYDVDGDGKMDLITARVNKPNFGASTGDLIWLQQPASDPLTNVPWREYTLVSGPDAPDVWFTVTNFGSPDAFHVIAAQFFTKAKLAMYSFHSKNLSLASVTNIDASTGPLEYVGLVDLDNDGKGELLVNNHIGGDGGSLFAYTIPSNIYKGTYQRFTLATGFRVTEGGFAQASPGFPTVVFPQTGQSVKPSILLAGDGSQRAYLLTPKASGLTYNTTVLLQAKGVVGSIAAGDVNGDGFSEIAIPDYDGGHVHLWTFNPAKCP